MAAALTTNRLRLLEGRGQSAWQDNITRRQLTSGALRRLIEEDGISGVTSNPSFFEKAIGGSADYDDAIRAMVRDGKDTAAILDALIVQDIQGAADQFAEAWEKLPAETERKVAALRTEAAARAGS